MNSGIRSLKRGFSPFFFLFLNHYMYPQKNLKYGLYQKTENDNSVLNFIFKLDIIPTSNIITQDCSCLKEKEGQRMEKRLKGRPSRDWTKRMQILAANHWTEQGDHNEGVKGRPEEAEGLCNCVGGTTISRPTKLSRVKSQNKEYTWKYKWL